MNTKHLCLLGLFFFLLSYLFFSKVLPDFKIPIDLPHLFNIMGACLLLSFNDVFSKNKWNSIASFVTFLGVVAHVGLCTIDFILFSFGNDDLARDRLNHHISNSPFILYSFIVIGPSLLFIGLSLHTVQFIKKYTMHSVLVFLSSMAIGFSFFVLKNGVYMLLSCIVFVLGLGFFICKNDNIKMN